MEGINVATEDAFREKVWSSRGERERRRERRGGGYPRHAVVGMYRMDPQIPKYPPSAEEEIRPC